MLPRHAAQILLARTQGGQRPALPVIVSFVGETEFQGPHVFAQPGVEYDWRFLYDLEVLIATKSGIDCLSAVRSIFDQGRLYPMLVDVELRQGAWVVENKPLRLWHMGRSGAAWKALFA